MGKTRSYSLDCGGAKIQAMAESGVFAVAPKDMTVKLFQNDSDRKPFYVFKRHKACVVGLLHIDDSVLASIDSDGTIYTWKALSDRYYNSRSHRPPWASIGEAKTHFDGQWTEERASANRHACGWQRIGVDSAHSTQVSEWNSKTARTADPQAQNAEGEALRKVDADQKVVIDSVNGELQKQKYAMQRLAMELEQERKRSGLRIRPSYTTWASR